VYPGTAQFFGYPGLPPIISGTGKPTDFKFGQYIQRVHPNKSPLKFLENVGKSSRAVGVFPQPLFCSNINETGVF